MNLVEFKYNNNTHRLRLINLELITLEYIKTNIPCDILQLDDQYYTLQILNTKHIGNDTFVVFEDVKYIVEDLYSKVQEVIPGITIVGKQEEVKYKCAQEYNICDGYVLKEHYKPLYDNNIVKYVVRTQVQYYDKDTRKIYNLMCYLPFGHRTLYGGAININHSTETLDEVVISMAKLSHKLNLVKC